MDALVRRVMVMSMLLAAIDGCIAGCGSAAGSSSSSRVSTATVATSSSTSTTRNRRPRHRRAPPGRRAPPQAAPIGRAQTVHAGSSILSVTITRVYDPLPAGSAIGLPGTRTVGVALTIGVVKGATYDSTASGDVSVLTSSGMPAPVFIRSGVCATPLTDFESLIGVGETHPGCVGFTIPRHARIVAVQFSPHSRARGTVTWR